MSNVQRRKYVCDLGRRIMNLIIGQEKTGEPLFITLEAILLSKITIK